MIKRITVTEDHLKLIPFIMLDEDDYEVKINKTIAFSIQSSVLDDISLIIGISDRAIANTKNDAEGRAFSDEDEKYMLDLYHSIVDNLFFWESLIHQFVCKGGLTVGTYKCVDSDLIWEKED